MKSSLMPKIAFWWQARTDRERKILVAWSAVVVLLLLWFGVLTPLFQRINALEKRVPMLESQLNRMRARPLDAGRSSGALAAGQAGEDLRSVLFGLLAERKISAELRALSTSRVEMRLPELPMKEALDLLDALRRETGARVAVLNVSTEAAPKAASRVVVELERAP